MNDNDVPEMPDRLEIKITAEDYAKVRELSKTSDIPIASAAWQHH